MGSTGSIPATCPYGPADARSGRAAVRLPQRHGAQPDAFPRRNRIVAGCCDGVLVLESGISGGSLITADLAIDYNRDVLAVPGRIGDKASEGCLALIRQNKAALVTSAADIADALNWRESPLHPNPSSRPPSSRISPPASGSCWKL